MADRIPIVATEGLYEYGGRKLKASRFMDGSWDVRDLNGNWLLGYAMPMANSQNKLWQVFEPDGVTKIGDNVRNLAAAVRVLADLTAEAAAAAGELADHLRQPRCTCTHLAESHDPIVTRIMSADSKAAYFEGMLGPCADCKCQAYVQEA